MNEIGKLYEFVFRGHMTETALDMTLRQHKPTVDANIADVTGALSLDLFDPEYVEPAVRMAVVYTAIAAFENSVRRFVTKVLADSAGDNWWETSVSEKIRKFADTRREDEQKTKWHGTRGSDLLSYTELGQLVNIMQQNWSAFEPYVQRIDWATSIFAGIERSRNVIMHSGTLDIEDIERLGMLIRDWIKQVGL